MAEAKIRQKLRILDGALDELDDSLQPLLGQTLPESLVGLEMIQQAKLQVDIPYVVYDLIFIYLKTRGVDPKTHPVVAELDLVRQYFDKIKRVQEPEKRKTVVDRDAANRFIKHAISQVKLQQPPRDSGEPADAPNVRATIRVPQGATSKLEARVEHEKAIREMDEEERELEIYGGDETPILSLPQESIREPGEMAGNGKGDKGRDSRKRRRPLMDPFEGYQHKLDGTKEVGVGEVKASSIAVVADMAATEDRGARDEKRAAKKARKKAKRIVSET